MWGSFRLAPIRLIFFMYLGCSASYLEVTIIPGTLFCNFGSNYVLRVLIFVCGNGTGSTMSNALLVIVSGYKILNFWANPQKYQTIPAKLVTLK